MYDNCMITVQNSKSHLASHTVAPQITGMHDTMFIEAMVWKKLGVALLFTMNRKKVKIYDTVNSDQLSIMTRLHAILVRCSYRTRMPAHEKPRSVL